MAKNHLRLDPSRTTMLRRQFVTDMNKRFREIKRDIKQFLVTDDELGLKPRVLGIEGLAQKYAFLTNPQKTKAFRDWLQVQIDAKVLSVEGMGRPWTNTYINSAYRKGYVRSYADTYPPAVSSTPDFFQGGQQQFIKDAFAQPEALSKLEMLFTRTFEDLKDVTTSMSAKMNRILTDGIAHGDGPETISREMFNEIDKLTRTRARVIARTEVINAHAEGQLDSFERLGVDELNLQAEWVTAGDDRVCIYCQEQEGRIYSVKEARGLIPLHPNCRCAWVPVSRSKKKKAEVVIPKPAKKKVSKTFWQMHGNLTDKEAKAKGLVNKRILDAGKSKKQLQWEQQAKFGDFPTTDYDEFLAAYKEAGLSYQETQFGAVEYWTGQGSDSIRKFQLGKLSKSSPDFIKTRQAVGVLDKIIKPAPSWRGSSFRGEGAFREYKVGKVYEMKAYTSTSQQSYIADTFIDDVKKGYFIKYKVKSGVDFSGISANAGEWEVVLKPGSRFRVVSIKQNSKRPLGILDMVMEEI